MEIRAELIRETMVVNSQYCSSTEILFFQEFFLKDILSIKSIRSIKMKLTCES